MGVRISGRRELETPREVMAALGGTSMVSALTGYSYGRVENWNRAQNFPANTYLVLTEALRRKRLTASPKLWRMVTPEERRAALTGMIADQRSRAAS
jgi:hypothetical protein